ncbi:hypothetical protein [Psychroserpens damuponensis]|uniref:hypothetical protein n=1 Tax=Psychroserpens damuponensis TaxID=943936 RepID=UPI00058CF1AB|nr:hypothetical protein [Psychroserpens damuponensis]
MSIRFLMLFISIVVLSSCQPESRSTINFAEALEDCLSKEDINQLNKATAQFEKKLIETYGSKNSNKNYLLYLEDLGSLDLNPNFITDSNSKKALNDLKKSGTFNKIWMSLKDLKSFNSQDSESDAIKFDFEETKSKPIIPKIDIITINQEADYCKCLLNNEIHESLNQVLETQSDVAGLSLGLTSKTVANSMTPKDLDNQLHKVVIATLFYYPMVHLANQNL